MSMYLVTFLETGKVVRCSDELSFEKRAKESLLKRLIQNVVLMSSIFFNEERGVPSRTDTA